MEEMNIYSHGRSFGISKFSCSVEAKHMAKKFVVRKQSANPELYQ
jgi:hypothetical protein